MRCPLSLPTVAVDDAVWDRHGALRAADDIDIRVREMTAHDGWIIEGGNTRTYAERVKRADVIIRLEPPIWQRLYRVIRRDGLKRQLLWWTWRYDKVFALKDRSAIADGRGHAICIEIYSGSEMRRLLDVGVERF